MELAEDPSFTVFAGEPPDFGSGYDSDAALDEEFGVEKTISADGDFGLDLDDAEGADADFGESVESSIATGMASDVGPNDFELDLSEAIAEQIMASSIPTPSDSVEIADEVVDDDLDVAVEADADDLDIEGFGFDDKAKEPETAGIADDDLDLDLGTEEVAVDDLDLDIGAEEVAVDDLDLDIGTEADEATLDLDTEPELKLPDEEPDFDSEPGLDIKPAVAVDDDAGEGGIEFSLDDDATEAAEPAEPAEAAEETADDEGGIDFGDLEMDETPDKEK